MERGKLVLKRQDSAQALMFTGRGRLSGGQAGLRVRGTYTGSAFGLSRNG